jgi:hypothetical protein
MRLRCSVKVGDLVKSRLILDHDYRALGIILEIKGDAIVLWNNSEGKKAHPVFLLEGVEDACW